MSLILLNIHLLNNSLFWSTSGRETGIHSSYSNIWYQERIFLACFFMNRHGNLSSSSMTLRFTKKYNSQMLLTRCSNRILLKGTIPPRMQCAHIILFIPTLSSYCPFSRVLGDQKDQNRMMYKDTWRQDHYSGHFVQNNILPYYTRQDTMWGNDMECDGTQHNTTRHTQYNKIPKRLKDSCPAFQLIPTLAFWVLSKGGVWDGEVFSQLSFMMETWVKFLLFLIEFQWLW